MNRSESRSGLAVFRGAFIARAPRDPVSFVSSQPNNRTPDSAAEIAMTDRQPIAHYLRTATPVSFMRLLSYKMFHDPFVAVRIAYRRRDLIGRMVSVSVSATDLRTQIEIELICDFPGKRTPIHAGSGKEKPSASKPQVSLPEGFTDCPEEDLNLHALASTRP